MPPCFSVVADPILHLHTHRLLLRVATGSTLPELLTLQLFPSTLALPSASFHASVIILRPCTHAFMPPPSYIPPPCIRCRHAFVPPLLLGRQPPTHCTCTHH